MMQNLEYLEWDEQQQKRTESGAVSRSTIANNLKVAAQATNVDDKAKEFCRLWAETFLSQEKNVAAAGILNQVTILKYDLQHGPVKHRPFADAIEKSTLHKEHPAVLTLLEDDIWTLFQLAVPRWFFEEVMERKNKNAGNK